MRRQIILESLAAMAIGTTIVPQAFGQLAVQVESTEAPATSEKPMSLWSAPPWEEPALTVGDDAPAIDVEHWLSDGKGSFKHIEEFEAGKVYVVEFWSTGCGPCIQAMPHISKLQQDFADRGVQIISVSDEPLEAIQAFLAYEAPESGGKTFGEMTANYCLATDPDRSAFKSYMEGALRNGIPQAFVVGKDGKIEWVGHPAAMEPILEQIVADKWDRDAFAAEFEVQQRLEMASMEVMARASDNIDEANAMIDELVTTAPNENLKQAAEELRENIGIPAFQKWLREDQAKAGEMLPQLAAQGKGKQFFLANLVVPIERQIIAGEKIIPELYEPALKAVDEAIPATEGFEKEVYRCLRVRLLQAKGEIDQAIKEEEALLAEATAPEKKEEYQGVLDQLQAAKKKGG